MMPFIKWAGGKADLVEEIAALLPPKFETLYEPFFGGAAVFLGLAGTGRFERAVLVDANPELVATFQAVKDDVEWVIREVQRYTLKPITAGRYYEIRAQRPRNRYRSAARMIVLNKTGYNGLYRVNRRGGFNAPYGDREHVALDLENLRACSAALQCATLLCGHYHAAIVRATDRDAVYLDPPYEDPDGKTGGFREYTKDVFDLIEQDRLAASCLYLTTRGVPWVASNIDNAHVRGNYAFANMKTIQVGRAIGAQAKARKKADELLIWNSAERIAHSA